LHQIKKQQLS